MTVAGRTVNRRRSGAKASQVGVFSLTCDRNRPQEQKSVADRSKNADLRRFVKGPATPYRVKLPPL